MKKEILYSGKGRRADIGHMIVYRILPNRFVKAVGPFVFLDYLAPQSGYAVAKTGAGAHPHRGIATLSYVLNGIDTHYDSAGNYAAINSGGIQWMKAGNGIIHDETLVPDPNSKKDYTQALQFWINLPAKNKSESPEYMAIAPEDIPTMPLKANAGYIKIITGSYENLYAEIPEYSKQFLYHIHLNPCNSFTLETKADLQYAVFSPETELLINDIKAQPGESCIFSQDNGEITLRNIIEDAADIFVFGGAPYTEPIVSEGPFVMNSYEEIAESYRDFHEGKYGIINYNR